MTSYTEADINIHAPRDTPDRTTQVSDKQIDTKKYLNTYNQVGTQKENGVEDKLVQGEGSEDTDDKRHSYGEEYRQAKLGKRSETDTTTWTEEQVDEKKKKTET